jgi:hypothetical protein
MGFFKSRRRAGQEPASSPESSSPPASPSPELAQPSAPAGTADDVEGAAEPDALQIPEAVLRKPRGGVLSGGKKALEEENAELRSALEAIGATERERLRAEVARLRAEHEALIARQRTEIAAAEQELAQARQELVEVREEAILQEIGIYDYQHPLESSVAYKGRLESIRDEIKTLARDGQAVVGATDWTVNGSRTEGRRMVRDFSKLMLRAYNNEADNAVRSMKPHRLASATQRLEKSRETISKLGRTMNIQVTEPYHRLRVLELEMTADYLAEVAEEKERERAERERLREEERAQREFEREKARLRKEAGHYETVLARLRESGDEAAIAEAEAKLAEINDALGGIEERAANIRTGYVYVISNVGAFGERMVKIGLTRRLEPLDRIRELGDASVPFRYDVHALVFSKDAVGLESKLHQALAYKRVNLVNMRREFFYATPAEVRDLLGQFEGNHLLSFEETPEALEWHQSENTRRLATEARSA